MNPEIIGGYTHISVTRHGGTLRIEFTELPEQFYPLTFNFDDSGGSYTELAKALRFAASSEKVAVVVIAGGKTHFSSGGSFESTVRPLAEVWNSDERERFYAATIDVIRAIRDCPKPVLGMVRGPARPICGGGGFAIALACDALFATPDARFMTLFERVGLSGGDMGALDNLISAIGTTQATAMLLFGQSKTGAEAHELGFVSATYPYGD
ncbi:MAG: enoyl-CoA hydratase/isomerase family protein, partial [Bdellovibrionales bacterium]|nr:enoyl-CoA hydratase/isomerase family protein [Bdellovibrionales bacterium]